MVRVQRERIIILRVDEEQPDSNVLRDLEGFQREMLEESATQATTGVALINGQAAQQDGGYLRRLITGEVLRSEAPQH